MSSTSFHIPEIATFADPTLAEGPGGAVHDASWRVETRLGSMPVRVVLDATEPIVRYRREMIELAHALPFSNVLVIWNHGDAASDRVWGHGWTSHDLTLVARLPTMRDPLNEVLSQHRPPVGGGHALLLVGGRHGLFTRAALERLQAAQRDLPLFTAIAAHTEDLDEPLRASGGGRIALGGPPHRGPTQLELAIEPGPDVAISVHEPLDRPPLVDVDRLRLDAIAPQPDAPIFTVAATVRTPGAAWSVTRFHVATRARARPPR